MAWWPFGKKNAEKSPQPSLGREGPPGRPEGAKCRHCGKHVSTNDLERNKCPHCGKNP